MELEVINEITEETKNFKSIEEFNLFYQKHKDEMNGRTTQYLNRVYKIITSDGVEYRITKKNCSKEGNKRVGGDIFLKKVFKKEDLKELEQDVIRADIESVKDEIKQMISRIHANELLVNRIEQSEKKIIELTSTVNQIAKYINTMNNM